MTQPVGEGVRICGFGHAACKPETDIAAGDIILFFGEPHLIAEVETYTGPFDFISGVARARDGWGISLGDRPWHCVEVA